MSQQKPNYHHGDLGHSLVTAASEMIQQQGVEALSMRKLADHVGVSRTAPYHHFKDKNEILCAIAEAGFKMQDAFVGNNSFNANSSDEAENGQAELETLVQSYIQFATAHPAHYDLMYGGRIWKNKLASETLQIASRKSFKYWLNRIEALQARNVLNQEESSLRQAQVAWATLHGLCRLSNDGVYIDSDDVMEMGRSAVRMMLRKQS